MVRSVRIRRTFAPNAIVDALNFAGGLASLFGLFVSLYALDYACQTKD